MIGVVVASHGGLCRELLITAEMILGPAAQTAAAPLAAGVSISEGAAELPLLPVNKVEAEENRPAAMAAAGVVAAEALRLESAMSESCWAFPA